MLTILQKEAGRDFSLAVLQELDFELEAANSKRCQSHLNSKKSRVKGKVVVPQVEAGMINKRVLVMEYVEGFKVTDRLTFLHPTVCNSMMHNAAEEAWCYLLSKTID